MFTMGHLHDGKYTYAKKRWGLKWCAYFHELEEMLSSDFHISTVDRKLPTDAWSIWSNNRSVWSCPKNRCSWLHCTVYSWWSTNTFFLLLWQTQQEQCVMATWTHKQAEKLVEGCTTIKIWSRITLFMEVQKFIRRFRGSPVTTALLPFWYLLSSTQYIKVLPDENLGVMQRREHEAVGSSL